MDIYLIKDIDVDCFNEDVSEKDYVQRLKDTLMIFMKHS